METATRYLETIESLMVENSRLTKELQDALIGKLPSRIISQEEIDRCFYKISSILGPTARGGLLDEVSLLCNEFQTAAQEYLTATTKAERLEKENKAIEHAANGDDVDDTAPLVTKIVRLRAVLEVTKTRLDRLAIGGSNEVADLRRDITRFLSGDKNE